MLVICINEKWIRPIKLANNPAPYCGQECTVIKSVFVPQIGVQKEGVYYQLEGYGSTGYHADNFATLPNQTADEMGEDTREAIINIEKQLV